MAPVNAEVYVDDERKGSVGSSGRVVLTDIPAGQHILARFESRRKRRRTRHRDPRGGERTGHSGTAADAPQRRKPAVAVAGKQQQRLGRLEPDAGHRRLPNCGSRFAEGVKFCGRCGSRSFALVSPGESPPRLPVPAMFEPASGIPRFCGRCGLSTKRGFDREP